MAITIWFWFCSALKPPWHNYCFRDQFVSDCAMMRCAWLRIRGRGGLLRKLWCATWGLAGLGGLGGLRIPPRPTWSHTWRHWVLLAEIWALGLCFFWPIYCQKLWSYQQDLLDFIYLKLTPQVQGETIQKCYPSGGQSLWRTRRSLAIMGSGLWISSSPKRWNKFQNQWRFIKFKEPIPIVLKWKNGKLCHSEPDPCEIYY